MVSIRLASLVAVMVFTLANADPSTVRPVCSDDSAETPSITPVPTPAETPTSAPTEAPTPVPTATNVSTDAPTDASTDPPTSEVSTPAPTEPPADGKVAFRNSITGESVAFDVRFGTCYTFGSCSNTTLDSIIGTKLPAASPAWWLYSSPKCAEGTARIGYLANQDINLTAQLLKVIRSVYVSPVIPRVPTATITSFLDVCPAV